MRSIFGRWRVTQRSVAGSFAAGIAGSPAAAQASVPPSSVSAATPAARNSADAPWLSFSPFWQTATTRRPAKRGAAAAISVCFRRIAVGISRGSAAKSSSVRTSMIVGASGRPIRRESCSADISVKAGMGHPFLTVRDATLGPRPHGAVALSPCGRDYTRAGDRGKQPA